MSHGESVNPVVIWRVSITFPHHKQKPVIITRHMSNINSKGQNSCLYHFFVIFVGFDVTFTLNIEILISNTYPWVYPANLKLYEHVTFGLLGHTNNKFFITQTLLAPPLEFSISRSFQDLQTYKDRPKEQDRKHQICLVSVDDQGWVW